MLRQQQLTTERPSSAEQEQPAPADRTALAASRKHRKDGS